MSKMINDARKGKKEVFISIYNEYCSLVTALSFALIGNTESAGNVVAFVFREAFESLISGRISTESELHGFFVRKTIVCCKTRLLKADAKCLRAPLYKNFVLTDKEVIKNSYCDDEYINIINNLPVLQKFIVVSVAGGCLSEAETAKLLNIGEDVISNALNAEKTNVSVLSSAAVKSGKCNTEIDSSDFRNKLVSKIKKTEAPESVEAAVLALIDSICDPIIIKARQKIKKLLYILLVTLLLLATVVGLFVFALKSGSSDSTENSPADNTSIEEQLAEAEYITFADIDVDGYGVITIELNSDAAPATVNNFVSLVKNGFYDGRTFGRVLDGVLSISDDADNETTIVGEFSANGYNNHLSHTRGAISMDRQSGFNSATSRFFIVDEDKTEFDGQYAVFGYVTSGMDIVDAICSDAKSVDDKGNIPQDKQPIINSAVIRTESKDSSYEITVPENYIG